jgi:hypothetical protein
VHRVRSRLTYSNVVATTALFLVLAGGSAFAATQMLPRNSVGAKQIKKGAVTPAKLAPATKTTLTGPRGAAGPPGPKGDTGSPGPSGLTRGFERTEAGESVLLGTSPFGTTAVSLPLPAGTYFVTTNMEFLGNGANLAFCRLINGTGGAESEGPAREQSVSAGGDAENLTMSGLFTVRTGQEMHVQCSRTNPATTLNVDRIDITAVQVQEKDVTFG